MAKEIMKDPGSFYLFVLSSLHGHKMAAATPISHILTAAFKEHGWGVVAAIFLSISLFSGRKIFPRTPPPGSLLGSIGQNKISLN